MSASRAARSSAGAPQMRIEARVEQGDDLRRDAGMLAQRRPHIVLGIGHADLPQEAREGAQERDVAPEQAGGEHQRVVAVAFGAARASTTRKHASSRCLSAARSNGCRDALSSIMSWNQTSAAPCGRDMVGALVDDLEAHVLQDRHPLGQRDRAAVR